MYSQGSSELSLADSRWAPQKKRLRAACRRALIQPCLDGVRNDKVGESKGRDERLNSSSIVLVSEAGDAVVMEDELARGVGSNSGEESVVCGLRESHGPSLLRVSSCGLSRNIPEFEGLGVLLSDVFESGVNVTAGLVISVVAVDVEEGTCSKVVLGTASDDGVYM